MKIKTKRGGARVGAGRKPSTNPIRLIRVAATAQEYLELLTLSPRERTEILILYLANEQKGETADVIGTLRPMQRDD